MTDWLSGDEQMLTPDELDRERAAGRIARLAEIEARSMAATPGPWHWVGNTDNHEIHLESRKWVILGTQRIERTAEDRDIDNIHDYIIESGIELLDDDELRELGLDPDLTSTDFDGEDFDSTEAAIEAMEAAIDAAQVAHQREVAVAWHLQEDDWGQVRYDERLAMRTAGDDSGHLLPLEQQPRYNVCPDAEDRSDPRVYRADYTPRSPDAVFIAHARADVEWLLAEVQRLRALVGEDISRAL